MAKEDDNLTDPLAVPGGSAEKATEKKEAALVEPVDTGPSDNLDIEFVDEFNADDFDEEFDDDFEEEVEGEYDLADDQYGEEFDKEFGHLTDPTRTPPKKAAESKRKPDKKKKKK